MDKSKETEQKEKTDFNGSFIAMEEGTLASLGLDPEKASTLGENYGNYRKDAPNGR